MRSFAVKCACPLKGEVRLPADKSIAHRYIIAASLSPAKIRIENFPTNEDCLHTLSALKKIGVRIKESKSRSGLGLNLMVFGRGLRGLEKPKSPIFVGDSGTTLRLLLGVLAGQDFRVTLTGGESLSQRPMRRVTQPLRLMGAHIVSRLSSLAPREENIPITIKGGDLKPITYKMPVASAQVKSAILLAGLFADGATRVIEPVKTRDHTERILKVFKADIKVKGNTIVIKGNKALASLNKIYLPADISSASFFIVAALLCPGSKIKIKGVTLNPTRTGALRVLRRMGADIKITSYKSQIASYEPMGDIVVKSSRLRGTVVRKNEIPSLIDELPILMVAAALAKGRTVFEGVGELRVKETDRIRSMSENLKKMGADIQIKARCRQESILITGVNLLKQATVRSFGDHRTAMSMIVAGLRAQGTTKIDDIACIKKSFPAFLGTFNKIL